MSILADYRECRLCPRECRVDRTAGDVGVCGETDVCRSAHAGAHFGEEPSFSGRRGSGTIFFSGCGCRCFFCQNHQISLAHQGTPMSGAELEQTALELIRLGVHNLNLVTLDHFWPHVRDLCRALRARGVTLPIVFNCSGYARPELVDEIAECVDIFLPDFKFADPELARACMGDARYPQIALSALRRMVARKGFLEPWDPTGAVTATRGVLVRHLVLPGEFGDSLRVLRCLFDEFGPDLPLSIMSQFRPTPACRCRGRFLDPLPLTEYRRVREYAEELGFERAYIQPEAGDEAFLPDFDCDEPFTGNS